MTGGPLSALMQFAHAIRKIGAGTGIAAQRYRGDARQAMIGCIGSVPCWIMPTWRVSEALPAQSGIFDLVVIDEASQSDAMALPALLRAKKVLIVGDDRQVSPSPIGIEERRLLQLRRSHLKDQTFRRDAHAWSVALRLGPGSFPWQSHLTQRTFSLRRANYPIQLPILSRKIKPVRIPKPSERLDPPLVDVFVDGGQATVAKSTRRKPWQSLTKSSAS